jgi:hypothetical protein
MIFFFAPPARETVAQSKMYQSYTRGKSPGKLSFSHQFAITLNNRFLVRHGRSKRALGRAKRALGRAISDFWVSQSTPTPTRSVPFLCVWGSTRWPSSPLWSRSRLATTRSTVASTTMKICPAPPPAPLPPPAPAPPPTPLCPQPPKGGTTEQSKWHHGMHTALTHLQLPFS